MSASAGFGFCFKITREKIREKWVHAPIMIFFSSVSETIGVLANHDGDAKRERHQTKGLMSKTIVLHVRFESLCISLPSSAKQQREMFKVARILENVNRNGKFIVSSSGIERKNFPQEF